MKPIISLLFFLAISSYFSESKHTFLGTNVGRPLVYHYEAEYKPKAFRKVVENIHYSLPPTANKQVIQGILALDLTNSEASANVTQGGLGFTNVNIRMKSERGEKLHYDIYVYV